MKIEPQNWQLMLKKIEKMERVAAHFFTNTLPAYSLVRVFLGIIYFWFGILKFNFIPGQSPAEDLIRSVWGPYLNANNFIFCLAIFETCAGALLLLNVRPKLVSLILIGHVIGTFATVIIDPSAAFRTDIGYFSLTLAGQYIIKNLLILSSCIFLMYQGSRSSKRRDFRVQGSINLNGIIFPILVQDISEGGVCFLVQKFEKIEFNDTPFVMVMVSPMDGKEMVVTCRYLWNANQIAGDISYYRVGCCYSNQKQAMAVVRKYVSGNVLDILEQNPANQEDRKIKRSA